jgi:hypothetical protein
MNFAAALHVPQPKEPCVEFCCAMSVTARNPAMFWEWATELGTRRMVGLTTEYCD